MRGAAALRRGGLRGTGARGEGVTSAASSAPAPFPEPGAAGCRLSRAHRPRGPVGIAAVTSVPASDAASAAARATGRNPSRRAASGRSSSAYHSPSAAHTVGSTAIAAVAYPSAEGW